MTDEPNDHRAAAASTALQQALQSADWEALLPSLLAYAARRLRRVGWASGRDQEPSKMSVEQLVHTAVESSLDGSRNWDPTAVDLGGFLRGVIRSLTSSEKKKVVRAKTDAYGDFDRHGGVTDSAEAEAIEEEGRQELLRSIEGVTSDDPDLQALYQVVIDGYSKREDIATALGWTVDRVTAARIKLQRRLLRHAPERFAPARDKRRRIP